MTYRVRIRNNATTEIRECMQTGEFSEFAWTEGNYSCDCNRSLDWQRAGGTEENDLETEPCGDTRYTAIDATLENGTVVTID